MTSFFSRILDALRFWLGLDHERLHPSHGWLLPPVLARVPVPVTARAPRGPRR